VALTENQEAYVISDVSPGSGPALITATHTLGLLKILHKSSHLPTLGMANRRRFFGVPQWASREQHRYVRLYQLPRGRAFVAEIPPLNIGTCLHTLAHFGYLGIYFA
jgi:hypothetical protein